jgi:sugar lactone lactonase YvrE
MLASAGMKVDDAARRLWVCGGDDAGSSRVYVYGLDDASLIETFELGLLVDTASCNDLALDGQGAAYVTDPPSSALHRLAVGGDASVWATDPLFDPELMDLGLNGIAVTPDGTAVIVTKFISKQLLRVSMDDPTQIGAIDLTGEDFAGGSLIAGPDGIVFEGDVLYVVFDDVVAEVVLNPDWTSGAVSILTPPTTGLSTATVAEGEVYAVKSEVTAYALGSAPELPFRIVRVPG